MICSYVDRRGEESRGFWDEEEEEEEERRGGKCSRGEFPSPLGGKHSASQPQHSATLKTTVSRQDYSVPSRLQCPVKTTVSRQDYSVPSRLQCPVKTTVSRQDYSVPSRLQFDARVCLDDMTLDEDNEVYTYGCRCGGEFSIGREEAEEEEAIVCCDTCSLSIEVKRTT
ncbi:unnamed protein product [Coregonus sp. 'balchen']|nr:unnamed protein product [Coregonus sp. 'balchen']